MFSLMMGLLALGLPFFALRRWEKGRPAAPLSWGSFPPRQGPWRQGMSAA